MTTGNDTKDADIDLWPGGLAQQYPYAEGIVRDILAGVVEESSRDRCSSQVLSEGEEVPSILAVRCVSLAVQGMRKYLIHVC